ncbi:MAG: hypothetical protein ACJ77K_08220 [Bacteroidia bacterium]
MKRLLPVAFLLAFYCPHLRAQDTSHVADRIKKIVDAAQQGKLNARTAAEDTLALNDALYFACDTGSVKLVSCLLENGADIHYTSCSDPGLAAQFAFGAVKVLLFPLLPFLMDAELGQDCSNLLEIAFNRRNYPVARLLAEKGLYSGQTMTYAYELDQTDIFEILYKSPLRKRDDVAGIIYYLCDKNDPVRLKNIIADLPERITVDHRVIDDAVEKDRTEILRLLVEGNIKIDMFAVRPEELFNKCIEHNNPEMASLLSKMGLSPDVINLRYALIKNADKKLLKVLIDGRGPAIDFDRDLLENCKDAEIAEYLAARGVLANEEREKRIADGKIFYKEYTEGCYIKGGYNKIKADSLLTLFNGKKVLFTGSGSFGTPEQIMNAAVDRHDVRAVAWLLSSSNCSIYTTGIFDPFTRIDQYMWFNSYRKMMAMLSVMIDSVKDEKEKKYVFVHCVNETKRSNGIRYFRLRSALKKRYAGLLQGK